MAVPLTLLLHWGFTTNDSLDIGSTSAPRLARLFRKASIRPSTERSRRTHIRLHSGALNTYQVHAPGCQVPFGITE